MAGQADVVATYGVMQRRAVVQTSATVARLWAELNGSDLDASWSSGLGMAVSRAVAAGQLVAASTGQAYVDAAVAAQGESSRYEPEAKTVVARQFSNTASDGRDLATLLYEPIIRTKTLLKSGVTLQESMLGGLMSMQRIVDSEIADAGRGAASVAMTGNRAVVGYLRQVRAGACARCVLLAGRWYRYNADFQRHKRCFPAGVMVSGPQTLAATRRWYEGELVVLTTASGQELPATGNHPVLTSRGWVAANLIQEGDEVVRSLRPQGASPLVVPDHQQMPARIEDVWAAESVAGVLRGVPTSAEDFHGDGGHGEVDVVGANRFLWGEAEPSFGEVLSEEGFSIGMQGAVGVPLATQRGQFEGVSGDWLPSDGLVGGFGESGLPLGAHLGHAEGIGLGLVAEVHASLREMASYYGAHDAVAVGDGLLALSSLIGGGNFDQREDYDLPRWDALGTPGSVEDAATDARVGQDLLEGLAGQVELDRVVDVRKLSWSGHVYDLNSSEGWFSANGLIVSNCQCYGVPATKDRFPNHLNPKSFFDGLSRSEQDRRFGVADSQAIRDGADIYSVVNAHRGVSTIEAYGGRVRRTTEGTSRHGDYYLTARSQAERDTGIRFAHSTAEVERGLPQFRLRAPRLMPAQIYRLTEDRLELIRLLRRYGYLH